jgi:hypothetical protein
VKELYGLLGQLNKDLTSAVTDALLDKMRAISRLEDEMCGTEQLAESASGLEL